MTLKPAMPNGPVLIIVKGPGVEPQRPTRRFASVDQLAAWQPTFPVTHVQIFSDETPIEPAALYQHFDSGVLSRDLEGTWTMDGAVDVKTALETYDWAYGTNYAAQYPYA